MIPKFARSVALAMANFGVATLAFGRRGNARVQAFNDRRCADRSMSGGFEGTNNIGDILGNGCKKFVVALLNGMVARYEIVPTCPGTTGRRAIGQ